MEPWIVFLLDSSLHRKPGNSTGTWKRDPKHRPCRFLSMLVPQADKQMTGGWGPLSLNWSQTINCRPKSPTKKRQSCKRHMLGFTAATWESLPGFCFAVPCRIACSGLCRMSDFGKESSKSMAEVSRLSALLEASGLAIQPSSIPSRLRRLEQISYVESRSVRDLDRLIPKFFICW